MGKFGLFSLSGRYVAVTWLKFSCIIMIQFSALGLQIYFWKLKEERLL